MCRSKSSDSLSKPSKQSPFAALTTRPALRQLRDGDEKTVVAVDIGDDKLIALCYDVRAAFSYSWPKWLSDEATVDRRTSLD